MIGGAKGRLHSTYVKGSSPIVLFTAWTNTVACLCTHVSYPPASLQMADPIIFEHQTNDISTPLQVNV